MTPHCTDGWLQVYRGDARAVLAELPAESVHCVVTSPPYWGLRDYGTALWEGGDAACEHVAVDTERTPWANSVPGPAGATAKNAPGRNETKERGGRCAHCGATRQDAQLGLEATPEEYVANMVGVFREVRRVLRADGTVFLNMGDSYTSGGRKTRDPGQSKIHPALENWQGGRADNPAGLKDKDLVGIPWRLAFALQADGWYLRSDIVWSKPNPMPESVTDRPTKAHEYVFLLAKGQWKARVVQPANGDGEGLHLDADLWPTSAPVRAPDADFCIRLASAILDSPEVQQKLSLAALDAEVRQQSATDRDRPLISAVPVEHRAAVLAARVLGANASPKEFLHELKRLGIALSNSHNLLIGGLESEVPLPPGVSGYGEAAVAIHYPGEIRQLDLVHGTIITSRPTTCTYFYDADAVRETAEYGRREWQGGADAVLAVAGIGGKKGHSTTRGGDPDSGRNLRSVWTIATEPYPGAHFATFPRKLVEPCIKAGTSERGVCPECGAPWVRVVERTPMVIRESGRRESVGGQATFAGRTAASGTMVSPPSSETTGWKASCHCCLAPHLAEAPCAEHYPPVPATVLDMFAGTGTVGLVAQSLSRRAILIDLNAEYLEQCLGRNRQTPLGLLAI